MADQHQPPFTASIRDRKKKSTQSKYAPGISRQTVREPCIGELHPALAERPRASAWPVLPPFIYYSMDDG